MAPRLANQTGVLKKCNVAPVRGSVTVWIGRGRRFREHDRGENRTARVRFTCTKDLLLCSHRSLLTEFVAKKGKISQFQERILFFF